MMAIVIAYDMYKECCEGNLRAGEWKQEKPVDFHRFFGRSSQYKCYTVFLKKSEVQRQ